MSSTRTGMTLMALLQDFYVRRSMSRGVDWSSDLIAVDNVFLGDIAVNDFGTVGLLYKQLVNTLLGNTSPNDIRCVIMDNLALARTAIPPSGNGNALGDCFRLLSVRPHFYGIFPAINALDSDNFLPNGDGQVRNLRNFDASGIKLLVADEITTVNAIVGSILLQGRREICQDNPQSRSGRTGGSRWQEKAANELSRRSFQFLMHSRVVVDGFSAKELGFTSQTSSLPVTSPAIGITSVP